MPVGNNKSITFVSIVTVGLNQVEIVESVAAISGGWEATGGGGGGRRGEMDTISVQGIVKKTEEEGSVTIASL